MKLAPSDIDFVSELLKRRASVVLGRDKGYLIDARLARVARDVNIPSTVELVQRIRRRDRRLEDVVVEAMLTHETSFFRDRHPFTALETVVIPELLVARAKEKALNIWSAACSSGQEPYSIAMSLAHNFPELGRWRTKVYATDLSTSVLKKAKAGKFSKLEVGRGLPAGFAQRFFRKSGTDYVVSPEVGRMIKFDQCNLGSRWPNMPQMDVIFIRNVMIYFDTASKRMILKKAHRLLRDDGYLFMGSTETMPGMEKMFKRKFIKGSMCFQKV